MQRTNPYRIHLYLLRPGERGEFQSLGSANGFLPSLWQVLLAETPQQVRASARPGHQTGDAGQWLVADARCALLRLAQFAALIARHPQFHQVDGLDRYLDATQAFLRDAIAQWESPGAAAPVLCLNSSRLPVNADGSQSDHVADQSAFRERFAEVIRREDFAAIETLLRFPSRNLRFTDWKAWSGMFGLAQFEPHYFSAAFREPFAAAYADHDYDEFGSGVSLGYGCHRFRQGRFWGVHRDDEDRSSMVLEPVWDRVLRTGHGERSLVWIRRNGCYGLADIAAAGRVLRQPDLDEVHGFQDEVAIARMHGKFGLLERSGQWRLPPRFDEIHAFASALAVVRLGSKFGFVDSRGATVIEPQFDDADDFTSAGVARVRQDRHCGLICRDGSIALPLRFTGIEWSDALSGWLCTTAGGVLLAHADGSMWVDGEWDAIEVLVRGTLLLVRRGTAVGVLRWSGEMMLACEFESVTSSDMYAEGRSSSHWKKSQVRTPRPRTSPSVLRIDPQQQNLVACRDGRVGLISATGELLVPFEFSCIDALEPQAEGTVQLATPELLRVVSIPGEAAPRVGVWNMQLRRCIVPCLYDFIWSALFAADGRYGFIVANRNPKRGCSSRGRYRVGLLRADGSVLAPQEYAWIAESTPLNRADAMLDIRGTLYHYWSRGEPVRASLGENGPLVGLNCAGQQCAMGRDTCCIPQHGEASP